MAGRREVGRGREVRVAVVRERRRRGRSFRRERVVGERGEVGGGSGWSVLGGELGRVMRIAPLVRRAVAARTFIARRPRLGDMIIDWGT